MKILNPANETVVAELNPDTRESIAAKVKELKKGQQSWAVKSLAERLNIIDKFGQLVIEKKDDLARILTSETGKPINQSYNEINGALGRIDHLKSNATKWLSPESITSDEETRELITFDPLGVICNISAWNFPYNVGFNVFLYALVAGNAVCYKPSEYASLTGLKFQELLLEAGVPADVFHCVIGGGDVGQLLLEIDFDGYFFTGSHRTGMHIAQAVATKLVPVQLELGGKDPLYVMDDVADISLAVANAAEGAYYNNGQSCCAVERIYVHEAIYDEFVSAFVAEVSAYRIGDPLDNDTFIGPLTRSDQRALLLDQIEDAKRKGAHVLLGGKAMEQSGYYFEPTVISEVNHTMKVMTDESFGPIIGIQKVASDDEAVELMADTEYGLTAAVFSQDETRARKVLDRLNVGTAYWNCCDRVSPNLPWSGRKNSGLGSTLSYMGIRAFVQPKGYHLRG
ncbi:MAG: aldehyde dehydrogenase family protein [Cyclobacteriaceae bacterium]